MLARFIESITRTGPYTVGKTRTDRGYGSSPYAFGRPYSPPSQGQYGPRYNVRSLIAPLPRHGALIVAQSLPKVDLRGNALYFAGSFGTSPLAANPGNG
jgi:hypothetical protein